MSTYETELRFKVDKFDSFIDKLNALGFSSSDWVLEQNYIFDDKDNNLMKKDVALRLRKAGSDVTLTYKGASMDSDSKTREEIVTKVECFDKMGKVLDKLGLSLFRVYEKKRKRFSNGSAEIVLEKIPFIGNWLEIEGESDTINKVARDLGLELDNGSVDIYDDRAEEIYSKGIQLTFENEKNGKGLL